MGLNRKQVASYQRAVSILNAKSIPFESVDGSVASNRERRNELFATSGVRGQYPQFFLVDGGGHQVSYLGDWDTIEGINDASGLPDDILEANPSIMTWDKVLDAELVC